MDLIDRYVYAVISKLPEKQRDDIAQEIKTLIDDMKEKYSDETSEETKIEKVLLELGNPKILAEKYLDKKRYLIGPNNFSQYVFTLKIVILVIIIAISIASVIQAIFVSDKSFVSFMASFVSNIISGILQGFTWVTIVFAILEYNDVNLEEEMKCKWNLKQLPNIPNKKARISKVESIVGIVFISLFAFVLYFNPELFGIYIEEDGVNIVIPIINLVYWKKISFLIIGLFLLGIAKEVLKLVYGKWNLKLATYNIFLSIVSMILLIILFSNQQIWNVNFGNEVAEFFNLDSILYLKPSVASSVIIKIIIVGTVIEIITVLYKGFKYNEK